MIANNRVLLRYLGLISVLAIPALILYFRIAHASVVFEPPLLLPILNAVFLFLMPYTVAYLAMRSYLADGTFLLLMLGCSVLAFGFGSLVAGIVIFIYGPNATATIHNISSLVAAIFPFAGVLASLTGNPPEADPLARKRKLTMVCFGVIAFIALLSFLTIEGVIPVFFVQGAGPTPLRQLVLAAALVLFAGTALYMMSRFFQTRSSFFYWYSLGLALLAIGMGGIFLQRSVGGLVGWLARSAQYLAGLYFLFSVLSAVREARSAGRSIESVVADLFHNPAAYWQNIMETMSDAIVSFDDQGRILLWNRSSETMFGYSRGEIIGKNLEMIWPADRGEQTPWLSPAMDSAITEMEFRRKDGSSFSAEVSFSKQTAATGAVNTFIIRDITERKQAQQVLNESESRYRLLSVTAGRLLDANDPQTIVEDLCREVMAHLDCHAFFNFLVDEPSGRLRLNAFSGIPEDAARKIEWLDFGVAICGCVAQTRERIIAEDIFNVADMRTDLVKSFGIQAYCSHPLLARDRLIGTLSFGTRTRARFTPKEVEMMRTVADQVAIAMERQQAAEALKDGEEKYRLIFESSLSGILTATLDGTILSANPAAQQILGMTEAEIIGRGRDGIVDTSDPRFRSALAERIRFGKFTGEMTWRRKDGSPFPAEVSAVVTTNRKGQAFNSIIFWDISWRKNAEKILQESEQRFREMADAMPQLVWTATPEGLTDYYNTRHLEFPDLKRDVSGFWNWQGAIHPDDLSRTIEFWREAQASGSGTQVEHRFRHRSGSFRWKLTRAIPVRNEEEKILKWVGTTTDIHDLKEAETILKERTRQLEEANRELESFTYSVSHDLRAPLRAIDGFSKMLLRDAEAQLDEESRRKLTVVRESTEKMNRLIDDLLNLSRLGRQALTRSLIDMKGLCREAWEELHELTPERTAGLKLDGLDNALGDRPLLKQVVLNLLSNALKFTRDREPAVIEITSSKSDGFIVFSVRDNGAGFDMKYRDKLFGVFQRLHSKSEYEGTGVGLAIVQRIINRHGGRVWAEGEVGKGAIFYFSLPATEISEKQNL